MKPPNLVFILVDEMRAASLGEMGQDPVHTPNLNKLAKEGVVFTNCISNAPVCSPFRAMLMSGQFPVHNGVVHNCRVKPDRTTNNGEGVELKQSQVCWSDILKKNGYSLGYIGKWHLDSPHAPYIPTSNNTGLSKWNEWCSPDRRHGFGFWYSYGTYDMHMKPMYWDTQAKRDEFHWVEQWEAEHDTDKAIEFLQNKGNKYRDGLKPFALVVSMNPPHMAFSQYPKHYARNYEKTITKDLLNRSNVDFDSTDPSTQEAKQNVKNYFSMVNGIDDQTGRILKAIQKLDLDDNTIVIFTSDHGEMMGSHKMMHKNTYYNESVRIPLIIRYPKIKQSGKTDRLFSAVDFYPTMLEMLGFSKDIPKNLDGISHAEFLSGNAAAQESSSAYYYRYNDQRGVCTKRYTLVFQKKGSNIIPIMFDNQQDPYQMVNIAQENTKLVKELTETELFGYLHKTNEDSWLKLLEKYLSEHSK